MAIDDDMDDELDEDLDDELDDDDMDDDDDDELDDDDEDDDIDIDKEEVTRQDAIDYAHHLEKENEKLAADRRILERTLKREEKAKAKKKASGDDVVDRDYKATGRNPDEPFKI